VAALHASPGAQTAPWSTTRSPASSASGRTARTYSKTAIFRLFLDTETLASGFPKRETGREYREGVEREGRRPASSSAPSGRWPKTSVGLVFPSAGEGRKQSFTPG
jgi:hypothetical protein